MARPLQVVKPGTAAKLAQMERMREGLLTQREKLEKRDAQRTKVRAEQLSNTHRMELRKIEAQLMHLPRGFPGDSVKALRQRKRELDKLLQGR